MIGCLYTVSVTKWDPCVTKAFQIVMVFEHNAYVLAIPHSYRLLRELEYFSVEHKDNYTLKKKKKKEFQIQILLLECFLSTESSLKSLAFHFSQFPNRCFSFSLGSSEKVDVKCTFKGRYSISYGNPWRFMHNQVQEMQRFRAEGKGRAKNGTVKKILL